MVCHVRSVSLCETTAKIAKDIPNFSEFVRTMLLIHADESQLVHTIQLEEERVTHFLNLNNEHISVQGLCNPFHTRGRCLLCWPLGATLDEQMWALKKKHSTGVAE